MSTLWTIVIIIVILAIMFWLVLSQNKEEDVNEENKVKLSEPLEGEKEKEETKEDE
ncbi:MAG: hypothetical protein PHU74_02950 [Candidatus Pacebacteria bacterium]|nr:hypothetical protein [Candidatus Paceibacterota bacterium]